MNFTAIDFETANRKRSSACSIGLAKVRDGKVVDTYHQLLKPEPEVFEYINIATHGITPEMVKDAPNWMDVWDKVESWIDDDVLVGHNVCFEQSVINQTMALYGFPPPDFDYLCTFYMARINYPRRLRYRLDDLCLDILGKRVNHHDALEDALACAELAIHHIAKFKEQDARKLIDLLYTEPVRNKKEWKTLTGIKPGREELDSTHFMFGKKVVLTGNFDTMSREKAVQTLVDYGGYYQEGVTKQTDMLVFGDQDFQKQKFGGKSNKMKKAEEYNEKGYSSIAIIAETEFLNFFRDEI